MQDVCILYDLIVFFVAWLNAARHLSPSENVHLKKRLPADVAANVQHVYTPGRGRRRRQPARLVKKEDEEHFNTFFVSSSSRRRPPTRSPTLYTDRFVAISKNNVGVARS